MLIKGDNYFQNIFMKIKDCQSHDTSPNPGITTLRFEAVLPYKWLCKPLLWHLNLSSKPWAAIKAFLAGKL